MAARVYRVALDVTRATLTGDPGDLHGTAVVAVRAESADAATRAVATPGGASLDDGRRVGFHDYAVTSVRPSTAKAYRYAGTVPTVVDVDLRPAGTKRHPWDVGDAVIVNGLTVTVASVHPNGEDLAVRIGDGTPHTVPYTMAKHG